MKINEIPEYKDRGEVLNMAATATVESAVQKMRDNNFGSVVITKGRKVEGIFTERDLLTRVVANKEDIKTLKLKDVMTTDVKTAIEGDDISDSIRRMSQGRFRHLPIVDENENLIGLVSQGDFVAFTWSDLFQRLKNKTQSQFLSHTQLWMMFAVMMIYLTIMPLVIGR